MAELFAEVKFHFFDLIFTPYKGTETKADSNRIMKACIKMIMDSHTKQRKAIVINRYEDRKDTEPRNIFISSIAFTLKENKYKCRIALIRDNKLPILVNKTTYTLTPFDELGNNMIAETTNFYIDLSGKLPVICCEFNNLGPRISDIEFYFRFISNKMLSLSKACKASIHMKLPVNEVLTSISDVLQFRLKAKPNRLSFLYQEVTDPFITNMSALANTIKPNSIKIDAFFRERGNSQEKNNKNYQALLFIKRILNAIKNDNEVIDNFEDFYLEFEREDGSDAIFNLMRGKQEKTIKCSYKSPGNIETKELFEKANVMFDEYLLTRKI
jgi:hypothetical protein